ncbi:MAG: heme ABC exporter ATP-binding protein CcmA [Alphaproteobacteria bacterium]|nr:heme ABC exporter ATP-binding protein CcmA [Alphaproteobacteria bacterium]
MNSFSDPEARPLSHAQPLPRFEGRGVACVRGERVVFTGLSFALGAGDALVLLGPNGSGKSSLLRVMAGLLSPAAGGLFRDGREVRDDPESHGAAARYVGHLDAVKPVLSVAENLTFWAILHGVDGAAAEAAVAGALERFGLSRLASVPGKLLSAGQKRRVNLARLLLSPSDLWLLDEPTTALDKASIRTVEAVLAEHRARGGMVVVSTHADIALGGFATLQMDEYAP